eukprot:1977573-Amphidinium_carterae.1
MESFADMFADAMEPPSTASSSKRVDAEQEHESQKTKKQRTSPEILLPKASGSGTCTPSVAWAKHLREGM